MKNLKKKLIGLSAHKFETNYSDGSTIKNQTVVSIRIMNIWSNYSMLITLNLKY